MNAVTEKLMAPALFDFGHAEMPIASAIVEMGHALSDIGLLSCEEAVEVERVFDRLYDEATAAGKSAVVCNLYSGLRDLCRRVMKEGKAASEKAGR